VPVSCHLREFARVFKIQPFRRKGFFQQRSGDKVIKTLALHLDRAGFQVGQRDFARDYPSAVVRKALRRTVAIGERDQIFFNLETIGRGQNAQSLVNPGPRPREPDSLGPVGKSIR
jgi:hypothetical protein